MLFGKDQKGEMGVISELDRKQILKGGEVLKLQPLANLTVMVKDEQGNPLQNAEVSVYGKATAIYGIKTDSKGQATLNGLCSGSSCNLSVELDGYKNQYTGLPPVNEKGWTGKADVVLIPRPR